MSALWGEMKVTARMPHAGKQCNQPGRQATSCSIAIWATNICHFDSLHQYTTHARGAVQDGE